MDNRIYIPTKNADSWKGLLKEPEKQWQSKFSARTLAYCWEDVEQFPPEFEDALKRANLDIEVLIAIPEYKVALDTGYAQSQNDLFVLTRGHSGLYVIMVEGKVSEPFDKLVKDWNHGSSFI